VNSFIGLFKDTTLVSIIAMFDPIRMASTIRATTEWGGIYWELYVFVGLTFFVFCFAMSRYSIWLERRLERSHAR
jgi:general L-amino acid transport system permease protein